MFIFDCRLAMAQFFGLDKVAKLRTIIKVSLPGIILIISSIKEYVYRM